MKLLGRRILEKFKGFFVTGGTATQRRKTHVGELSWSHRCKYYDSLVEDHPLAKQALHTIAGQLMAEGVYTEAAFNDGPHKQRSQEAKDRCDELNEKMGFDVMLYDSAMRLAKYGSCFWEKTWTPEFEVRLHPFQELLEPANVDPYSGVTEWRQTDGYREVARYTSDELVHHAWNVTAKSYPYGTSQLVGLDTVFETLKQMRDDIKEHMHHSAFPYELYQVGNGEYVPTSDEVASIKTSVKNWEPGEKHVTSYPIDLKTGGTGDKPISNLKDILDFLYNEAIDGTLVPPISKQWSSTMASATEMLPWSQANITRPMQRLFKRNTESQVYKPYLVDLGFTVKVVPKLKWEAPDAHKDEEAEYWGIQVSTGIVPADYAAEQQGFDMDKIRKMREEELARQAEMQQYGKVEGQGQTKFEGKDSWRVRQTRKGKGKSYLVTEYDEGDRAGSSR